MDLLTGKDGAVTAVDGSLFLTGIHRPKKECLQASTKAGESLYVILWDFLVQEVLRDNSLGRGKATNSYWIL